VKRARADPEARITLERQLAAWGLSLGAERIELLLRYARMLAAYEGANIVGERDPSALLLDHVLDSLSCNLVEALRVARRLADVGSGGGLPGVPIKVARPELDVALVEATGKKAHFMRRAVRELSLSRTMVLNARAEEVGRAEEHMGRYDAVTARALAPLAVLVEYCVPLARVGGHVVAMKGRLAEDEMEPGKKAAKLLGAEVSQVVPVPLLPEIGPKERNLVVLEKVTRTPIEYPRRPGMARKRPLGHRQGGS
jgi:16S rRNA (guanine527-N7)-methyltransferase